MRRSSVFPWTYLEAWLRGIRAAPEFSEICCYAMFIGQPRSGTSLIGSLLNSHRHMCIANELNALRYIRRGYGRNQLYWLLGQRDQEFSQTGRMWTGYDYRVPGQWQGRTEKLLVIGDKKAGLSSDLLRRDPELLIRLQQLVRVPIRIFHVVRNPFNVISTIHMKRKRTPLPLAVSMYFSRCATNARLMQDPQWQIKTFRLEDLIAQPRPILTDLCAFVGVEAHSSYLDACSDKLFAKPRQSQQAVEWPIALVRSVYQQMEEYPFLRGYEFQGRSIGRAA